MKTPEQVRAELNEYYQEQMRKEEALMRPFAWFLWIGFAVCLGASLCN